MITALFMAQSVILASATTQVDASQQSPQMHSYFTCLTDRASEIDDQVSDALTIAVAIKGKCPNEFLAWRKYFIQSSKPSERDDAGYVADTSQTNDALGAVLIERKMKARNSN